MDNVINRKKTTFETIEIAKIEELYKIEDEIWNHALTLDTRINTKVVEYDYDNRIWVWISDEAINRKMVIIPEKLLKRREVKNHLERYFDYKI